MKILILMWAFSGGFLIMLTALFMWLGMNPFKGIIKTKKTEYLHPMEIM